MKATIEEIIKCCRDNLAAYKVPSKVYLVNELPKSTTGKILKRVLRDQSAAWNTANAKNAYRPGGDLAAC